MLNRLRNQFASVIIAVMAAPSVSAANDYVGMWHLHSAKGYTGYLLLDGVGGCSYYIASAFLTIQATCVARDISDASLVVFGSQEGVGTLGPIYGDQSSTPSETQPLSGSTAVTFMLDDMSPTKMSGFLVTSGGREKVILTR